MEELLDLDSFVKAFTDKGYDGYFHTESCCAGRLKDSISAFLQVWNDGTEAPLHADYLHLSTYLQWNGEQKPKVECNMWVRYEDGKYNLQQTEMYIRRIDGYGQLLKESKLANLNTAAIPTVKEAVALVSDTLSQQVPSPGRKFKM